MTQTLESPSPSRPDHHPARVARLSDFLRDRPQFPPGYLPDERDLDEACATLDVRDLLSDAYEALTQSEPGSDRRRTAQAVVANEVCAVVERWAARARRRAESC